MAHELVALHAPCVLDVEDSRNAEHPVQIELIDAAGSCNEMDRGRCWAMPCELPTTSPSTVGPYSAEVIQVAATAIAARLRVDQVAALPLAFPSMAQGLVVAAAQLSRKLGKPTPLSVWDSLEPI